MKTFLAVAKYLAVQAAVVFAVRAVAGAVAAGVQGEDPVAGAVRGVRGKSAVPPIRTPDRVHFQTVAAAEESGRQGLADSVVFAAQVHSAAIDASFNDPITESGDATAEVIGGRHEDAIVVAAQGFCKTHVLCPHTVGGGGGGGGSGRSSGGGFRDSGARPSSKKASDSRHEIKKGTSEGTGEIVPRPGVTGKEAARDVPSWAKGNRPRVGENGRGFAERLLDARYGKGKSRNGIQRD